MFHFDMDIEPSMKKFKEELEKLQKRIQKAYIKFWDNILKKK